MRAVINLQIVRLDICRTGCGITAGVLIAGLVAFRQVFPSPSPPPPGDQLMHRSIFDIDPNFVM